MSLSQSRAALRLVGDVVRLVSEAARSHAHLAAENLFLRKQLALYLERQVAYITSISWSRGLRD